MQGYIVGRSMEIPWFLGVDCISILTHTPHTQGNPRAHCRLGGHAVQGGRPTALLLEALCRQFVLLRAFLLLPAHELRFARLSQARGLLSSLHSSNHHHHHHPAHFTGKRVLRHCPSLLLSYIDARGANAKGRIRHPPCTCSVVITRTTRPAHQHALTNPPVTPATQ